MVLYTDSQAHPNPSVSVLHVVQRGPPCLQLKGLCHRTNALPPRAMNRRKTRRKPGSGCVDGVLQGDNGKEGNFDCDAHIIQEFTVSYYCGDRHSDLQGKCCLFGEMPYFWARAPPAAVPALFIVLGIVLPVGILATLYIVSWKVVATVGAVVTIVSIILKNRSRVIEETVILVPGLGISIQKCLQSGVLHNDDFIHATSVEAVVIHEGFYQGRVVYFLAIMVKGSDQLVIIFKNILPRLEILRPVYKKLREHLPQT